MTSNHILILTFFCIILQGCLKDEAFPDDPPVSDRHTVVVYLGTDNNVFTKASGKIGQLRTDGTGVSTETCWFMPMQVKNRFYFIFIIADGGVS